jgi:hypothetical protein
LITVRYCGIFAESKNSGIRETIITRHCQLRKHATLPEPSLSNTCNNGGTVESGVFYAVRAEAAWRVSLE